MRLKRNNRKPREVTALIKSSPNRVTRLTRLVTAVRTSLVTSTQHYDEYGSLVTKQHSSSVRIRGRGTFFASPLDRRLAPLTIIAFACRVLVAPSITLIARWLFGQEFMLKQHNH